MVIKHISEIKGNYYDLIWSQHWVTLAEVLKIGAKADKIISCSLSPYEHLERFPSYSKQLSLLVANSQETANKRKHEVEGDIHVFPNSAPNYMFTRSYVPKNSLKKIALVNNHKFSNQEELTKAFNATGIEVHYHGSEQNYNQIITAEVLEKYDLVVTTGKTVQYCFALGVPVYCYGRFGGVGYINSDNFELAAEYNFSGRMAEIDYIEIHKHVIEKVSLKIIKDIVSNYNASLANIGYLKNEAMLRYNLETNVKTIFSKAKNSVDIAAIKNHWEFNLDINDSALAQRYQNLYYKFCKCQRKCQRKYTLLKKSLVALGLLYLVLVFCAFV